MQLLSLSGFFMDRDHIAQMHEYVLFHCCLPIKKNFFKYVIIIPLIEMQPYRY